MHLYMSQQAGKIALVHQYANVYVGSREYGIKL